MKTKELWTISRTVIDEMFFQSKIKAAGGQKSRLMDKYSKNPQSLKTESLLTSLIISFLLLVLALIPLFNIVQGVDYEITTENVNNFIFVNSISFGCYYILLTSVLLMFGLLILIELMNIENYKLLITLPLNKNDLQNIRFFVFLRLHYLQIIVMILPLPIISLLLFRNIFLSLTLLVINIINIVFASFFIIILANFMGNKIFGKKGGISKLSTFIRITTVFFYMVIAFGLYQFFGTFSTLIWELYDVQFFSSSEGLIINSILSLIPCTFSGGYLVTLTIIPLELIPIQLFGTVFLGLIISILLTIYIVKKGYCILQNIGKTTKDSISKKELLKRQIENVEIRISHPIISQMKIDITIATRNYSGLVALISPFAMTFIIILAIYLRFSDTFDDPFFTFLIFVSFFPVIISKGLFITDDNLSGVLSSLPINQKEVFRAKQLSLIIFSILPIFIIFGVQMILLKNVYLSSVIFIIVIIIINSSIFLFNRSYLFGRINKKYTFYQINIENKTGKEIIQNIIIPIIILVFSLISAFIIGRIVTTDFSKTIVIIIIGLISTIILELVAKLVYS